MYSIASDINPSAFTYRKYKTNSGGIGRCMVIVISKSHCGSLKEATVSDAEH